MPNGKPERCRPDARPEGHENAQTGRDWAEGGSSQKKKSKALAEFQFEMDKLESRVGRGEFTSIPQILGEFNGLMDRFVPLMTDQERAMIQDIQLLGHDTGARILARRGQQVPGNDPQKPN